MAITISGSGITSANIADGTIVNADVADLAASKLTGALPAIDGSALTNLPGGGKVLQVVSASTNTATEFTATTTWVAMTNFTATITPTATDSTILVFMNSGMKTYYSGVVMARIKRGATVVKTIGEYCYGWDYGSNGTPLSLIHHDSPATTSAISYTLELLRETSSGRVYFNTEGVSGSNDTSAEIILMEVSV